MEAVASRRYLTLPNVFTFLRLCCIPLFLYLLFGRDNRAGAAWLLGGLGATDWVDGWLARRFNQTSEFGKAFDPTTDRLLLIVAITGIIIDGSAPLWLAWAVVVREILVGGAIAIATVAFSMKRFDVLWLGKTATFLLMFSFPSFVLGASDFPFHQGFRVFAWIFGIPGLILSYYTAVLYVRSIRAGLREGRETGR
ncbi:MAG TPA: CDP-alcohol phosphatidyltransferase family protein [Ilumatobacteraceae bacterium]|nr:CDP-alcohol phosphatidyltransferase family protein [Ilumatobacteraceae bacterium]